MTDYSIFISHKAEDEATAIAVQTALGEFSGGLRCFISGDSIVEGENWRQRLRRELRESDLLLLLFTEPTRAWDWCLYEVGLFLSLDDNNGGKPVVCMYNPDGDLPSPLATLQGVRATEPDVSRFIARLIRTTDITGGDIPLNANVSDEGIDRAAGVICDHFMGTIHPYYACYRVYLELPADVGEQPTIPPESRIVGSEGTMRIFGRLAGTTTWGELVQSFAAENARWLDEIGRVFGDACGGRVSAPTTYTFRAHDGARIFRPELYRLDKKGNTPVAAVVMFTEEVAPSKVGGPVFNRLRIAERYKTEVFDRLETASDPLTDGEVTELTESFDLIREEAKTQNVFEDETLRTSFPDADMKDAIRNIGAAWDEGVAALSTSRETADKAEIRTALRGLDDLNDRYRAIVARRYLELLGPNV